MERSIKESRLEDILSRLIEDGIYMTAVRQAVRYINLGLASSSLISLAIDTDIFDIVSIKVYVDLRNKKIKHINAPEWTLTMYSKKPEEEPARIGNYYVQGDVEKFESDMALYLLTV